MGIEAVAANTTSRVITTSTTASLVVPTNMTANDVLVVGVMHRSGTHGSAGAITPPAGFTLAGWESSETAFAFAQWSEVWIADAADLTPGASYTFTQSDSERFALQQFIARPSVAHEISVHSTSSAGVVPEITANPYDHPAISPAGVADGLAVLVGSCAYAGNFTISAGWTQHTPVSITDNRLMVASRELPTGDTVPPTFFQHAATTHRGPGVYVILSETQTANYADLADGRDTVATTGAVVIVGSAAVTDGTDTGGWFAPRINRIAAGGTDFNVSTFNPRTFTAPTMQFGDVLIVAVQSRPNDPVTVSPDWTLVATEVTPNGTSRISLWAKPETVGLTVGGTVQTVTRTTGTGILSFYWTILRPTAGSTIALPVTVTATSTDAGPTTHVIPPLSGGLGSLAVAAGAVGTTSGTADNDFVAPWLTLYNRNVFNNELGVGHQQETAWDGYVDVGSWRDGTNTATVAALFEIMPERFMWATDGRDIVSISAFVINPVTTFLSEADGRDSVAAAGAVGIVGSAAVTDGTDTPTVAITADEFSLGMTLRTTSTLFPERVGVTVGDAATATHTVVEGVTSRTVGANPVLTGDFAYRGLYTFDTTIDSPGDFVNDARGWVTLASWGDFALLMRRRVGSAYDLRAEFVTAAAAVVSADTQIDIMSGGARTFGLGVTRNATTGAVTIWQSADGWDTWTPLPLDASTTPTGALGDAVPDPIVILGGDLRDGPWVTVFRAQWGATDNIAGVDANEVIAWNYGPSIVSGVGGNFYDDFDGAVLDLWAFGANSSHVYQQRSETSAGGTTVRADFTTNAPTLATAAAPAGTESAFSYDLAPQWDQGPPATFIGSPILFSGSTQFTVNHLAVETIPETTVKVDYGLGSGPLPSVGDAITWPGGGTGVVFSLDSGDATTGSLTITHTAGPIPVTGVTITSGGWTAIVGAITVSGFDGTRSPLRALLVDNQGTAQHALTYAAVQEITWGLDEPEAFSFLLPILDPLNAELSVADQEVQVWRGSRLLVWGVVVRSLASSGSVEYQCRGLAWYFSKRFVGGPRNNHLLNPSFEIVDAWWWIIFAPTELPQNHSQANWSARYSTDRSLAGFPGRSLRLSSNGTMEFGIMAIQNVRSTINSDEWPDGMTWTAAAWAYIPSTLWGEFDAGAGKVVGERNAAYNWGGESAPFGLHLGRFSTTESQNLTDIEVYPPGSSYPKVEEIAVAGLTESTPRDEWVRIEVSLVQPAKPGGGTRTDIIQVELHCPVGVVYWDEVSLTRNDRLYFNEVPQEDILAGLVEHAQDPAFGKSDLNIGVAPVPPSGVTRTRSYEFFNRELILDAIDEFPSLWKGADWSIECSSTQRLFTAWSPMKGSYRPAQALLLGRNIASITVANDGERIANRVAVASDGGGTGSSREEAMFANTAGFASGLVLEEAINAAKESPLDSLDGQAQQAVRQKRSMVIPTLTTYEGVGSELMGRITVGDVVPVEASHGGLVVSGDYRIVAITFNPASDTLNIVVNPFTDFQNPFIQ